MAILKLVQPLLGSQPLANVLQYRIISITEWSISFQRAIAYLSLMYFGYVMWYYLVYQLYLHPINQLPGPPPDHWAPFLGHLRIAGSKNVM